MMMLELKHRVRRTADALRLATQKNLAADFEKLARLSTVDVRSAFVSISDADWLPIQAGLDRLMERGSNAKSSGGSLNHGDRRAIYTLIRHFKPQRVLEIGTHLGSSTLYISAALKENARQNAPGQMLTVDVVDVNAPDAAWARAGALRTPRQMLEECGTAHLVEFRVADSLQFLRSNREQFDFCFLDGSHSAKWVYNEVQLVQRALRPGSLILLHDFFPDAKPLWQDTSALPGPWMAINRLRREGAAIDVLPLGSLPWPTKARTTITSLALLGRA
jgi:predicted O-methyltransferase YrrM